jgi:hypothetical protein
MEASTLPFGSPVLLVSGVGMGFDSLFSRKMDVDKDRDSP